MTKTTTTQSPEFVSITCAKMEVNLANAGKFISVEDAKVSLKKYIEDPSTPNSTAETHIYGHVFGINSLKKVLLDIDIFNAKQGPKDPKIAAIKCYYGISKRDDPDFPLKPQDGEFRDLIFMPMFDNGNDIETIGFVEEEILSGSRPCPNQCGDGNFFNR